MLDLTAASSPARRPARRGPNLRGTLTPLEAALWRRLQSLRGLGLAFRRGVPIGPYDVDFACLRRRVIVEIGIRDRARDAILERQGYYTIRLRAECDPDALCDWVERLLRKIAARGSLPAR